MITLSPLFSLPAYGSNDPLVMFRAISASHPRLDRLAPVLVLWELIYATHFSCRIVLVLIPVVLFFLIPTLFSPSPLGWKATAVS